MTETIESAIASLDRIDYSRAHRVETRDLPCDLSPAECQSKGKEYAAAVRRREALEAELAAELKRRKGEIEVARGEQSRLLKIIETGKEDRPIKVREFWGKLNGEDVLIAVRDDLYNGLVDVFCYVGHRYAQVMDRQAKIPGTAAAPSNGPSEEALQRQADAALASAEPLDGEPLPFEEEEEGEDRSVVPFPGAAEPETEASDSKPAKRSRKARATSSAAKAAKETAKGDVARGRDRGAKGKGKGKAKA